jgi:hypothetical protein
MSSPFFDDTALKLGIMPDNFEKSPRMRAMEEEQRRRAIVEGLEKATLEDLPWLKEALSQSELLSARLATILSVLVTPDGPREAPGNVRTAHNGASSGHDDTQEPVSDITSLPSPSMTLREKVLTANGGKAHLRLDDSLTCCGHQIDKDRTEDLQLEMINMEVCLPCRVFDDREGRE